MRERSRTNPRTNFRNVQHIYIYIYIYKDVCGHVYRVLFAFCSQSVMSSSCPPNPASPSGTRLFGAFSLAGWPFGAGSERAWLPLIIMGILVASPTSWREYGINAPVAPRVSVGCSGLIPLPSPGRRGEGWGPRIPAAIVDGCWVLIAVAPVGVGMPVAVARGATPSSKEPLRKVSPMGSALPAKLGSMLHWNTLTADCRRERRH
jgi:hypothetical protein